MGYTSLADTRHPGMVVFQRAVVEESPPMFITDFTVGGDLGRHYMAMRREHQNPNRRAALMRILEGCVTHKMPRPQQADEHASLRFIMLDAWAEDPSDRPDARELIRRRATIS
ncbi:unnamed protein product [Prorocentrum cordatum]|uniref:Protein kinase domain-containing protein n=1 Tax=Prorocentrum cordatum TaxID=2364126 RepID=A0ABN9X179_9DINO|nr:unnamed protein product [Polarella glacialis]